MTTERQTRARLRSDYTLSLIVPRSLRPVPLTSPLLLNPLLSFVVRAARAFILFVACAALATAEEAPKAGKAGKASASTTVGPAIGENKAPPVSRIKAAKDFRVELIYSVPGVEQGSWVNLCVDPQGRILASDQFGGLYRFTPPPAGRVLKREQIEKLPTNIRAINGMLWAFGALYVGVNDQENKIPSCLYRISNSAGSDQLDKVELLRSVEARGDRGMHAVVLTPDGKGLCLVCGNGAKLTTPAASSPVPAIWGEDHLLPRMPDGRGFMRDVLAPGGII